MKERFSEGTEQEKEASTATVDATPKIDPVTLLRAGEMQAEADLASEWKKYAKRVEDAGGVVPSQGSAPTVLALRTQTAPSKTFQDLLVVLHGDPTLQVFRGSTVPSFKRAGMGILVTGNYRCTAHGTYGPTGKPSFEVHGVDGGNPPAWRDADGDGKYTDAEKKQTSPMTGELIHSGHKSNYEELPNSEGCLTLPYSDMDAFISAVGGKGATFNLTVVDK